MDDRTPITHMRPHELFKGALSSWAGLDEQGRIFGLLLTIDGFKFHQGLSDRTLGLIFVVLRAGYLVYSTLGLFIIPVIMLALGAVYIAYVTQIPLSLLASLALASVVTTVGWYRLCGLISKGY